MNTNPVNPHTSQVTTYVSGQVGNVSQVLKGLGGYLIVDREIHVDGQQLVHRSPLWLDVRQEFDEKVFSLHISSILACQIPPGRMTPPIFGCRLLDYFGKLSFCKRPNCLKESSKHHLLLINQTINKTKFLIIKTE